MSELLELLARYWVLLLFFIGPILSGLGKIFTSAARKAEEARRAAEERDRAAQLPSVRERAAAAEEQARRERAAQQVARRQKAEQTAAKVRELIEGRPDVERLKREREAERRRLEAEAAAAGSPRPPALPPPAPPAGRRPPAAPKAPPRAPQRPQPRPQSQPRPQPRRVAGPGLGAARPSLGESVEQRATPASGAVGASRLGSLGGRVRARRRPVREFRDLIQTENLPAMFIAQEVLGKPVSLRDFDGPS